MQHKMAKMPVSLILANGSILALSLKIELGNAKFIFVEQKSFVLV